MKADNNPFFKNNKNFDSATPFDQLKAAHFLPGIKKSIQIAEINISEIAESNEEPSFQNVVLALENSSELLDTISSAYYHLFSAEAGEDIEKLAQEISPLLAKFSNDIYLNKKLFKKITHVDNYGHGIKNEEDERLVKVYLRRFIRNGASLSKDKKDRLREIDTELSSLSPKFSSNLRQAINKYELWIDSKSDLSGLPQMPIDAAKEAAIAKNEPDKWLFTLQFPSMGPFMKFSDNRKLREELSKAFSTKCLNDEFDNSDIIKNTVKLRHERAGLLGYKNYAEYILEERMAGAASDVYDLLDQLYDKAYPVAANEVAELRTFAEAEDGIEEIQSWDYAYYSEKMKKMMFDFDEEELRPYFKSENVVKGVFEIANRLYGISFEAINDIPVWNKEVQTYKAIDEEGEYLGLLYVDLHPRPTKKGGAWMNELRSYGLTSEGVKKPHICFTCNLTKSTEKQPSLLSFQEVTTVFHEFGHCLHGLLSKVSHKTIGGTSVYWDFVELPSQIMENWVLEKEALSLFAKHYKTEKPIPEDLMKKLKKSKNFMTGNMCLRQLQFGYLDMAYHDNIVDIPEIEVFEDVVLGKTRLLPKVDGASVSCSFGHIFAGGYAAGYYSYKWAEVLEADAFEKFKEDGIFNKDTAKSFRENILSKGNLRHPMELFKSFRGRGPEVEALLRRDGLSEVEK